MGFRKILLPHILSSWRVTAAAVYHITSRRLIIKTLINIILISLALIDYLIDITGQISQVLGYYYENID